MCFCQLKGYFRSALSCNFLPESYWCAIIANYKSLLLRRGAILAVSFFPPLKGHPLFFVSRWRFFIHVKRCQCLTVWAWWQTPSRSVSDCLTPWRFCQWCQQHSGSEHSIVPDTLQDSIIIWDVDRAWCVISATSLPSFSLYHEPWLKVYEDPRCAQLPRFIFPVSQAMLYELVPPFK